MLEIPGKGVNPQISAVLCENLEDRQPLGLGQFIAGEVQLLDHSGVAKSLRNAASQRVLAQI